MVSQYLWALVLINDPTVVPTTCKQYRIQSWLAGVQAMPVPHDVVLHISAPGVPPDVVSRAQQELVNELNERAPIADVMQVHRQERTKGAVELIGQVGLALLSAGLLNHIAQVIVEFVKRNNRYSIKIDDIEITKDNASAQDMERIGKQLHKIMAARQKSNKP
jgi:hypothetical protein